MVLALNHSLFEVNEKYFIFFLKVRVKKWYNRIDFDQILGTRHMQKREHSLFVAEMMTLLSPTEASFFYGVFLACSAQGKNSCPPLDIYSEPEMPLEHRQKRTLQILGKYGTLHTSTQQMSKPYFTEIVFNENGQFTAQLNSKLFTTSLCSEIEDLSLEKFCKLAGLRVRSILIWFSLLDHMDEQHVAKVQIDHLRTVLPKFSDNTYADTSNFKKRVLMPALEELDAVDLTDIDSYEDLDILLRKRIAPYPIVAFSICMQTNTSKNKRLPKVDQLQIPSFSSNIKKNLIVNTTVESIPSEYQPTIKPVSEKQLSFLAKLLGLAQTPENFQKLREKYPTSKEASEHISALANTHKGS